MEDDLIETSFHWNQKLPHWERATKSWQPHHESWLIQMHFTEEMTIKHMQTHPLRSLVSLGCTHGMGFALVFFPQNWPQMCYIKLCFPTERYLHSITFQSLNDIRTGVYGYLRLSPSQLNSSTSSSGQSWWLQQYSIKGFLPQLSSLLSWLLQEQNTFK